MFSRLGDDVVIKILALASAWPHMFLRLTCIQFNRLSSAFRAAATSETLVVASRDGVWMLNQERGCWVACGPLPEGIRLDAGVSCGGEVMVFGQQHTREDIRGKPFMVAFDPKLNMWRDMPAAPFDATHSISVNTVVKLDDERVR